VIRVVVLYPVAVIGNGRNGPSSSAQIHCGAAQVELKDLFSYDFPDSSNDAALLCFCPLYGLLSL
jgi:hypothetical protein